MLYCNIYTYTIHAQISVFLLIIFYTVQYYTYIILYIEMGSGAVFMTILVPALYRDKTLWFPNFDPYNLRYSA